MALFKPWVTDIKAGRKQTGSLPLPYLVFGSTEQFSRVRPGSGKFRKVMEVDSAIFRAWKGLEKDRFFKTTMEKL